MFRQLIAALLFSSLYSSELETWNFGLAKALGVNDRKSVNITNINRSSIVQPRELSLKPKSKFRVQSGISAQEITEAKEFVLKQLPKWEGWCTFAKASDMMDLIFEIEPEVIVEIGVFGGSSLFPLAYSLKTAGKGVVYGIDAWDNEECVKYMSENNPNYNWWKNLNLETIHQKCLRNIKAFKLQDYIEIIHKNSADAVDLIPDGVDLLHIDGNHQEEAVFKDVILYLPKVRLGGYIWINATDWKDIDGSYTNEKALYYLLNSCEVEQIWHNQILFKKLN